MTKQILIQLFFIFFLLNSSCRNSVLTSSNNSISLETLQYLLFINKYNSKAEVLLKKYKLGLAKVELAKKLGLLKNKAYKKYLFDVIRTREQKSSLFFLKKQNEDDILSFYKYKNKIKNVLPILTLRPKGKNKLISSDKTEKIILGTYKNNYLNLKSVFSVMRQSEIEELLSLKRTQLTQRLQLYIKRTFYHYTDIRIQKFFNADSKQIKPIDQAIIADLFLQVKYNLAADGIYPTKRIKIKFTPKELYSHFYKMRYQFLEVEKVKYSIANFKNIDMAKTFILKLKTAKDFKSLYEKMGLINNKKAGTFTIMGNQNLTLAQTQKRLPIDSLVLSMAKRREDKPKFYKFGKGFIVIKIDSIKWEEKNIKYKKYKNAVAINLNKTLLARQYKVDLQDTIKINEFKIKLPNNYKIKKLVPNFLK